MDVIDHQPDRLRQRRQVLQKPLHDRPPVQVRRRRQLPHQPRPRSRLAQRAQHRRPEPLRIPLIPPHRHPRGAVRHPRLTDPGPQQDRLPAPRRRRHHRHPRPRPKPPEQPNTRNDSSRTRGDSSNGTGLRPARQTPSPYHHTNPGRAPLLAAVSGLHDLIGHSSGAITGSHGRAAAGCRPGSAQARQCWSRCRRSRPRAARGRTGPGRRTRPRAAGLPGDRGEHLFRRRAPRDQRRHPAQGGLLLSDPVTARSPPRGSRHIEYTFSAVPVPWRREQRRRNLAPSTQYVGESPELRETSKSLCWPAGHFFAEPAGCSESSSSYEANSPIRAGALTRLTKPGRWAG